MEYETGKYKFVDTGSHVVVFRDGEKWGVPQGHNFLRVLLQDIQQLQIPLNQVRSSICTSLIIDNHVL